MGQVSAWSALTGRALSLATNINGIIHTQTMTPIYLVAGARPNFVKLAPLVSALRADTAHPMDAQPVAEARIPFKIVHTGQHYDEALSGSFFQTLGIPAPDIDLDVGSGTHGVQTARILERFEGLLLENPPRAVVVFGDVNSTLACAVAASKLQIPVAHVEAGLRSFDRCMPEEINRIVTDVLSDLLLVSEPSGLVNLGNEGISPKKIRFTGNIMIDSLERMLPQAIGRRTHERFGLPAGGYAYLTLHRPSNVDQPEILVKLMSLFIEISRDVPLLFAAHPRTRRRMEAVGISTADFPPTFRVIEPVDYLDSLCLQKHARLVFTDSGGIQEESTCLDVPCLTLRENTERPITVERGTSTLVGNDPERILGALNDVQSGTYKHASPIPYWDGNTATRIADILTSAYS
jgi:UDP-N-acetylglucosamine 2-epimerase (non-hydrolysing)